MIIPKLQWYCLAYVEHAWTFSFYCLAHCRNGKVEDPYWFYMYNN